MATNKPRSLSLSKGTFPQKKHLLKSNALHFCMLLTRHPWLGTAWQGGRESRFSQRSFKRPRKRHIQGILASRLNTVEKMALPPKKNNKKPSIDSSKIC
ncbi:MAG: hypothetical protein II516_07955 [Treponema sp.]|nr:hypothetical protein [Treponema sp.]